MVPILAAIVTFLLLDDPLIIWYPDKFLLDFRQQVTEPLTGVTRPIIFAHFYDVSSHRFYWLRNLWWSLGRRSRCSASLVSSGCWSDGTSGRRSSRRSR
jgi:hypothetical protein